MKKIEKIAHLAKIHVGPREAEILEASLEDMLAFFAQLQQLDTSTVDPFLSVVIEGEQPAPLRHDEVDPTAHVDVTQQTRFKDHGMFKVPSVLES